MLVSTSDGRTESLGMSTNIHGTFRRAFMSKSLNEVDQNQASFQAFDEKPYIIGTQGLRGCLVVIIASQLGAVFGHIGPDNIVEVMEKVKACYDARRDYFPNPEAWIVKANIPDAKTDTYALALELARSAIVARLAEIGFIDPGAAGYSFHLGSDGNSPEFPDKGTVVAGRINNKIEVWVENRLLRRW